MYPYKDNFNITVNKKMKFVIHSLTLSYTNKIIIIILNNYPVVVTGCSLLQFNTTSPP